jgi:hypothetical protein
MREGIYREHPSGFRGSKCERRWLNKLGTHSETSTYGWLDTLIVRQNHDLLYRLLDQLLLML